MGQLIIEVPQEINRTFYIKDEKFADKVLSEILRDLEQNLNLKEVLAIMPPRRNSLKEDGDAVLGIWADRSESAAEIARTIRDRNNGKI